MFHRIAEIKVLPNCMVWAAFTDGAEVVYNVSELFDRFPLFRSMKDVPGIFEQVHIDRRGYGISWHDDIDLDAEELYQNGIHLKSPVEIEPGQFCPVCGQRIRRKSESQRAASIANLAKRRSKGGRPVNPDSQRQKTMRKSG